MNSDNSDHLTKVYNERLRTNNRNLDRLHGLQDACRYRINHSDDKNEIVELKSEIEKYAVDILRLQNDNHTCSEECAKLG